MKPEPEGLEDVIFKTNALVLFVLALQIATLAAVLLR